MGLKEWCFSWHLYKAFRIWEKKAYIDQTLTIFHQMLCGLEVECQAPNLEVQGSNLCCIFYAFFLFSWYDSSGKKISRQNTGALLGKYTALLLLLRWESKEKIPKVCSKNVLKTMPIV